MRALFAIVAALLVMQGECFIPNSLYNWAAAIAESTLSTGRTHKDITRSAVLNVAADLLKENPYNDGSRARILALSNFDEKALVNAYFGESRSNVRKAFEKAIEEIEDANSDVDDKEEHDPTAHFDAETFQLGQNRLYEIRQKIVGFIRGEQYDEARAQTGRMLHTLQDFYSHSNWVEMGKEEPNTQLGTEARPLVAKSTQATCTDCRADSITLIPTSQARYHYTCDNNLRNIGELLTSGYYSGQTLNGRRVEKPIGKCSHGGYRDGTADQPATGGINKDSPYPKLSPHGDLHFDAANVAEIATRDMLNNIRDDVNDAQKFGAYLNLFVKTAASIAYVIDVTGSMGEELPQIQATIPSIRASLEAYRMSLGEDASIKYILVPFNDPDPGFTYITEDIERFLNLVGSLRADGGGDTPEPSVGALIRALRESEVGSPIFVFTDAPASDTDRIREAQALISQKDIVVTYAYVGGFRRKRSTNDGRNVESFQRSKRQIDETYETIAAFSGGQVLNLGTDDLSELGDLVRFTTERGRTTILREAGVVTENITMYVDDTVEQVIISISGYNVKLYTPSGIDASTLPQYNVSLQSYSSFIASLTINSDHLRGTWKINLPTSSSYSVVAYAISDLIFTSQLFTPDPTSTYGFTAVTGKPLNGVELIAAFQANDRGKSISVERVNIVDSSGTILVSSQDIFTLGNNAFAIRFNPPAVLFYWQIVGKFEGKYNFSRISDTAIEVSQIDLTLGEGESGYYTLRPGDQKTISLSLFNRGNTANFTLSLDASTSDTDISSYITTPTIEVKANSTQTILVYTNASKDATNGDTVRYTLVAESMLENSNDFVIFGIDVTTLPPPTFTENEYGEFSTAVSSTSDYALVLLCSLLVILMESIMFM